MKQFHSVPSMAQSFRNSRFAPLPLDASLGAVRRRARELAVLRDALASTLGSADAAHLVGISFTGEHLTVFADSPVWCTRLRLQAPRLETAASGLLGRRPRLGFRTQPVALRNPPPPRAALSPHAAEVLRSAARSINDPALAAALRRLADAQPPTGPQAGPA